jgi:hypothetical protein
MLAHHEPVVRGEEDVGVSAAPGVSHRAQHLLDQLFHRQHAEDPRLLQVVELLHVGLRQEAGVLDPGRLVRDVGLVEGRALGATGPRGLAQVARRVVGRAVGSLGRHHQEERAIGLGRRLADELHGLPREHVGVVVLGLAAVRDDPPVLVHLVVVVPGVLEGRELDLPIVPPRRDVLGRRVARVVVQVLAEQAGPVAGGVELHGHRVRLGPPAKRGEPAVRPGVVEHAVVVGVAAAEDGRPRRRAQGGGRVGPGEARAGIGHERAEVGKAGRGVGVEVVGDDEHDVGAGRLRGGDGGRGRGRDRGSAATGRREGKAQPQERAGTGGHCAR